MHERALFRVPEILRSASAVLLALALAAALLVGATPARAQTVLTVDTTDDHTDCDPGDCSLRGAILEANATAGPVTIQLGAEQYDLTIESTGNANDGESGDLDVHDELTIVGAGSGDTIIDASAIDDRVLHVHGVDLTLHGVTIQGGDVEGHGGGLLVEAGEGASTLILRDVVVQDSSATGRGGGIYGSGYEMLIDFDEVVLRDNHATAGGGGLIDVHVLEAQLDRMHVGSEEPITPAHFEPGGPDLPEGSNTGEDELGGFGLVSRGTATVAISQSSFVGNFGGEAFGGLVVGLHEVSPEDPADNPVTLDELEVRGNAAGLGGGLSVVSMSATVRGSHVGENLAEFTGGMLGLFAPTLITDTTFEANDASLAGGAGFELSTVLLQRVTFADNRTIREGGGLAHSTIQGHDLVIEDSTFTGNAAQWGAGAHVSSRSLMPLTPSRTENGHQSARRADGAEPQRLAAEALEGTSVLGGLDSSGVGAAQEDDGLVRVSGTTFDANVAARVFVAGGATEIPDGSGSGGGLHLDSVDADITNSTFSGNAAADAGGGLLTELYRGDETVTLTNVTFSDNAAQEGAAIAEWTDGYSEDTTFQLVNTIVANSTTDDSSTGNCSDFFGVITSLGHNIDDDGTCGLDEDSDMEVDPLLGELADNGGPTWTHALLEGSPAIDAGDDDACPATDQRGFPRPAQGCDIGAYEVQQGADLAVTAEADPDPARATYDVAVDVTATNLGPALAEDATLTVDVPEGTAVRSVTSPEDVDCTIDGQQVTCDLGDVAPGEDVDITVIVRPADPGEVEITATVASTTHDPDETNNVTTVTFTVEGPTGALRLFGPNRIETAVMTSQDMYADGTAPAVVLARADEFADALTGTPLAIALDAPLLLTYPGGLHGSTATEIDRVLPDGGTVYLLGGTAALSPAVEASITALGYETERYFGADRFETAIDIATRGLGNPDTLLLATGWDFADALAGGAAGGVADGAVLLTAGPDMPASTQAYLATRGEATRYALGGPAAQADPSATALVGATRFQTAVAVAEAFFTAPRVAGVATAFDYPDALTGGAHVGRQGGPILLSTTAELHTSTEAYLSDQERLEAVFLYGGEAVLSAAVHQQVAATLE